ncbi:hypothetical protein ISS07_06180 [Candidatus Woesearchaeota archaeon]|nr:hypothetical protein [Candidatus Woesearchaeota archaeon]
MGRVKVYIQLKGREVKSLRAVMLKVHNEVTQRTLKILESLGVDRNTLSNLSTLTASAQQYANYLDHEVEMDLEDEALKNISFLIKWAGDFHNINPQFNEQCISFYRAIAELASLLQDVIMTILSQEIEFMKHIKNSLNTFQRSGILHQT